MKIISKSKFSVFLEQYYPWASVIVLLGIGTLKFYNIQLFKAFTDISYPSLLKSDGKTQDHYLNGPNDLLFLFFITNALTVFQLVCTKLILKVCSHFFVLILYA